MESENKYLKQIRDELKKKNGDTSHSLYNEPNTKAKYLRDIAKEIHKFDGGGGPEILPYVTDDDNGKILQVVNGKWTAVAANLESHELHGAITSNAESNNGVVSNSINGTYTVVEDGGES